MRNGYALCSESGLGAIARLIADGGEQVRDDLRGSLAIGFHRGVEVTDVREDKRRFVIAGVLFGPARRLWRWPTRGVGGVRASGARGGVRGDAARGRRASCGSAQHRAADSGGRRGVRQRRRVDRRRDRARDQDRGDSIVDLTTPADGLRPYQEALQVAAEKAGRQVDHYAHPIPDMGVIEQDAYDQIVARIRRETIAGRTVYLHCWGGKGRTSTVVGCLLIDGGLDYKSAIARIAQLRAGTRKAIDPCPESPSQHRLLRERAARRRHT